MGTGRRENRMGNELTQFNRRGVFITRFASTLPDLVPALPICENSDWATFSYP